MTGLVDLLGRVMENATTEIFFSSITGTETIETIY